MLKCGMYYNDKTYEAGRTCIYRIDCKTMKREKRHLTDEGISSVEYVKESTDCGTFARVRALRDIFNEETKEAQA